MSNFNSNLREQQNRILQDLERSSSHLELPNLPPPMALQRQVAAPEIEDNDVNIPPRIQRSPVVIPSFLDNISNLSNNPPEEPPPQAPRYNRSRRYAFFLDNINDDEQLRRIRRELANENNVTETVSVSSSEYSSDTDTDYDDDEKEDLDFLDKLLEKPDKESEEYKKIKRKIESHKKRYTSLKKKNRNLQDRVKNDGKQLAKLLLKNGKLEKYNKNYSRTMECIPSEVVVNMLQKNQCSICLTEADRMGESVITSCFHVFHKHCLNRAMESNKKCPMCRHDLTFTYSKNIGIGIEKRSVTNNEN